ncbi:MAG: hypothetical protein ACP5T3_00310 [Candidatus Micrarchaeia archaeon]
MLPVATMMLSIYSVMTSPVYAWFPVAIAGAIAIIAVLALVYELSPFFGRTDLRAWAKIKMYEVFFSIVLIFVFFAFMAVFSSINFGSTLGQLAPKDCASNFDIYALSMCDLNHFQSYVAQFNNLVFVAMFSTVPSTEIGVKLPDFSASTSISGADAAFGFSFVELSILFAFYMLSDVLLLLLSVSLLLFAVFMAIGLISRIFEVTRTFGGAMIAFGIGLGMLFPLLIALSYGFVDVAVSKAASLVTISGLESALLGIIFAPLGAALAIDALVNFFVFAGYIIAGIVFLPIFTLTIVDVFIRDFSRAVGEQMNFMSILTNMI